MNLKDLLSKFLMYILALAGSGLIGLALWTHSHAAEPILTNHHMILVSDDKSEVSRKCMGLEYKIDRKEMQRLDIMAHPRLSATDRKVELQKVNDDIRKLEKKLVAARSEQTTIVHTFDSLAAGTF